MAEDLTNVVTGGDETPKLFAGKYKTVEELEEGYRNSLKVHVENKELKDKYERAVSVPETYTVPAGLGLRESEIDEIKRIAKESSLTQEQFEKTARSMEDRLKAQREAFDEARKEIGQDKLILIEDHIKKNYPESIQQVILNTTIKDKKAMDDILKERDAKLDSRVPGIDASGNTNARGNSFDGQAEMAKAATEYERHPTQANKDRLIRLANEVGNERFKDKAHR